VLSPAATGRTSLVGGYWLTVPGSDRWCGTVWQRDESQVHCATARLRSDPVGCSGGTNAVHGRVVVTFFFLRISLPRVPRSADVTAGYNRVDRMTAGRAETNGHE